MRSRFIFPYNAYVGNQASYSNQWVSLGTYEFDAGYYTSNVSGRKIALCGDVIVDDGNTGWYPFGNWWDTGFHIWTSSLGRVAIGPRVLCTG
jgi:hypothetical protein